MKKKIKYWIIIIGIQVLILFAISIFAISIGTTKISFITILKTFFLNQTQTSAYNILLGLRVPRVLISIAIGGALSLAGTLLQGMFRNPLVEPYTLGISGGASIGICLTVVFKLSSIIGIIAYPMLGFIGAGIVIFIVYSLSIKSGSLKSNNMLLIGVMISFVSSSIVMLIMAMSKTNDLHSIIFWIMGSLDETNTGLIKITVLGSLLGLAVSCFYCLDLNAFVLGEENADLLGINTIKTKKVLFITASLLTGLSVSIAGIIMFVGLVVPHFMRLIVGSDHRILIISSFLGGASFLTLCDVIARTVISPLELPVGVITGIIGGITFIYVLSRKKQVIL